MAELLIELFSEEIPAIMQKNATMEFEKLVSEKFFALRIGYESLFSHVTPRRLMLYVNGMLLTIPDILIEKKGPKTNANEAAISGFLRSVNLNIDQLEKRKIGNDEFYFAAYTQKSPDVEEVLTNLINDVIKEFSWPKSMRWGSHKIRWVRPLKNILCLFDGKVLPVTFAHLRANNKTFGHRFMSDGEIVVNDFEDYQQKLKDAKVMLDRDRRMEIILNDANNIAKDNGLNFVQDEGLLEEVAGLVEWPVVLMGKIDAKFMSVPKEVLVTSMRTHQKYFSLENKDGTLAPFFITVANIAANDGGIKIIAGNERVLRARLSDAKFFYEQDLKQPLEANVTALNNVTFHAKLGSLYDKIQRIIKLALSFKLADNHLVERACLLAKADLTSQMVSEFPELQGIMGSYYAIASGEDQQVAEAIKNHYRPLGPNDNCPQQPVTCAVAMADKIDTIVGLLLADEKPTGSKDPYALRRAALGVIRIILENKIDIDLKQIITNALEVYQITNPKLNNNINPVLAELLEFFIDRLKYQMKSQDMRHDIIAAVYDLKENYNLYRIIERVKAVQQFLTSSNGYEILVAYRRASNIVTKEEQKNQSNYNTPPDLKLHIQDEEKQLYASIEKVRDQITSSLADNHYIKAMELLEQLRAPINNFFDKVLVNVDDITVRDNRLKLLAQIRGLLDKVANFQMIEG